MHTIDNEIFPESILYGNTQICHGIRIRGPFFCDPAVNLTGTETAFTALLNKVLQLFRGSRGKKRLVIRHHSPRYF